MTTEDTTAGSSRKRKGEKPIKSKEAKKPKLISKEKGKYIPLYIYIILIAIELVRFFKNLLSIITL